MEYMLTTIAIVLAAYMTLWFVGSIVLKRNDVTDIAWGLGFILVAWNALKIGGHANVSTVLAAVLAAVLVTVWGVRLAKHILGRFEAHSHEDGRYAQWQETWKFFYVRSFLQVFVPQGVLLYLIALPLMVANAVGSVVPVWMVLLGGAVWCVGFVFEVVGDAQLGAFLGDKSNRGKVMTLGLWYYTRHPNYFGEMTLWWGIWLLLGGWLLPLWAVIGPVTITVLLRFVSGVPMAEKQMAGLDGWEDYKHSTSMLIPLPPKR